MGFYPVIWRVSGGAPTAGRLELGPSRLTLRTGARESEDRLEIGYDEIVDAGRTQERIGRLGAFRIEQLASSVVIAAYGAAGLNGEILDQLQATLARLL